MEDGQFDTLQAGRPPTIPECLTCHSVTLCETARFKVMAYKLSIQLANAAHDIQQLESDVLTLKSRSAVLAAIKLGLLIMITTFAFSGDLPDVPRRTMRTRRKDEITGI